MVDGFAYDGPPPAARAMVLHPALKRREDSARAPEARLDEAEGLAIAIDLDIRHREVIPVSKPRPSTYVGGGAVERLAELVEEDDIQVAVLDCRLSPIQQRNLEKAWGCKVIDRTGLILEIFGARARTAEGRMQVELAHLSYQRSRLVRSWTHLERQRGGVGFMGGPGETQIEIDRRLIGERITKLRKDLEDVTRTRGLHRAARKRVPYPVVALVGYTNAGKSTLFNKITAGGVVAEDMLFATLDPTMRTLRLPSGRHIILSDTVGFVSELPHELVAAFRATLEEVREADLILHVRDISGIDTDAQKADVEAVLTDMDLGSILTDDLPEVLNKADLLDAEAFQFLQNTAQRHPHMVLVSAVDGTGLDALFALIDQRLGARRVAVTLRIPQSDGAAQAAAYRRGEVVRRVDGDELVELEVMMDPEEVGRVDPAHMVTPQPSDPSKSTP